MVDSNWKAAMVAEYSSVIKHDTWEIMDPPLNRKLIDTNEYGR